MIRLSGGHGIEISETVYFSPYLKKTLNKNKKSLCFENYDFILNVQASLILINSILTCD